MGLALGNMRSHLFDGLQYPLIELLGIERINIEPRTMSNAMGPT